MTTTWKRIMALLIMFFGAMVLVGCAGIEIPMAISDYNKAESKVKIGDTKEDVLAILQPTQEILSGEFKRPPEHWIDPKSGKMVDLYYFRSGWVSDGRLTDDEVTKVVGKVKQFFRVR